MLAGSVARKDRGARKLPLLSGAVGRSLVAYAAALFVGMWLYAGLRIQSDLRSTRTEQYEQLRHVASTLEAQVEAMLNDGIGAAHAAANELTLASGIGNTSDDEAIDTLSNMLTGGIYVRSLFVATPERYVRAARGSATGEAGVPPEWLRPVFAQSNRATWVGGPVRDPDRSDTLVIPVARRVVHRFETGQWAGALFAFSMLDDLYVRFASGTGGIALIADDGTVLLRASPHDTRRVAGQTVAQSDVFRRAIAGPPAGVVDGIGPISGVQMALAYDRVEGYPLTVVAGREHAFLFAGWESRRREILTITSVLSALLAAITWLLHRAVRSLQRREADYRTLFNKAGFSAFVLDGDRIIEANETARSMFGLSANEDLRGMTPWQLSPHTQSNGRTSESLVHERIERALTADATRFEWIHKRLDTGESFPAEVEISSLHSRERTLTLAVVHDVSQRKLEQSRREQAMAELRELAGTLVRLQDEERRRIGRELHDATGQCLATLEMKLSRAAQALPPDGRERKVLEECLELAGLCSAEIRTSSYLLHPPLLDEIGLVSALRWLADGLRQRSDIEVKLELPDSMDRLPRDHELALFRVAQEALTNVHRHSMSRFAVIRLAPRGSRMVLEIEDAGRGMPQKPGAADDGPALGVGLAGMRERMRQLGGTLTVRSDSNGTCVSAELPVTQTAPASALVAG